MEQTFICYPRKFRDASHGRLSILTTEHGEAATFDDVEEACAEGFTMIIRPATEKELAEMTDRLGRLVQAKHLY